MRDLAGRRVLLTRTEAGCAVWARDIERLGGVAVCLPCIRVEEDRSAATTERLRESLQTADWIAFASRRGVEGCRARVVSLPDSVRVAAVGPATAEAAEAAWGRIDLVAPDGTAASLGAALQQRIELEGEFGGRRVVTVAAEGGRTDSEERLRAAGVDVVRLELYRTVWEPAAGEPPAVLGDPVDVVLLASPSAARGLAARVTLDPDVAVITIGPTTTEAARGCGLRVSAESRQRTLDSMLEAIP